MCSQTELLVGHILRGNVVLVLCLLVGMFISGGVSCFVQSGEVQVFDVVNLVRDTILELPDSITPI